MLEQQQPDQEAACDGRPALVAVKRRDLAIGTSPSRSALVLQVDRCFFTDDLRNYARNVALASPRTARVVANLCNIRFLATRSRGNRQFL